LQNDACRGELRLDEAEPDGQFLLILGAKLDLRGRCCCEDLTIVSFRHVVRGNKRGGSPSNCGELFPGRKKERGSHCENSTKENKWLTRTKQTKWSAALTVFMSNKILLLSCRF
jgi:hypothetical protein